MAPAAPSVPLLRACGEKGLASAPGPGGTGCWKQGSARRSRSDGFPLLRQGPLKGFLEALGKLQKKFYSKGLRMECPIRTYLVTARSAASSGARALKTLRSWGLETDEALFLAGAPKGPLLKKIRPHIFFDDQMFHVEGAKEMGTVAAHVPYGVAQKHKRPAQEKQPQNSK